MVPRERIKEKYIAKNTQMHLSAFAFAKPFKDLGYPTTMSQAVTETGETVWQKDENGNLIPQMKRNSYGGADNEKGREIVPFVL